MAAKPPRRRRSKIHVRARSIPGALPGTLTADPSGTKPVIRVMGYGPEAFEEVQVDDALDIVRLLGKWPVLWINVDGLGDARALNKLGRLFNLHNLALEDVVNRHQQSKVEQYSDHLFVVMNMITHSEGLQSEQVSLFLGKNFVITFQAGLPGDCLDPVRNRIREDRGRIRRAGADYLAYSILDGIIDGYFPVLEAMGEQVEHLEDVILRRPVPRAITELHEVKRDLMCLRRIVWPLRESIHTLLRDPCDLISEPTRIYLRDCYDHCVRLIDLVEVFRELASDLFDLYLSSISHRMNDVMRLLTVFSVIFAPLTFIAGIYGMNFDPDTSPWNMPELRWFWGYPAAIMLMAAVGFGMLFFMARKGWLMSAIFAQKGQDSGLLPPKEPTEKSG